MSTMSTMSTASTIGAAGTMTASPVSAMPTERRSGRSAPPTPRRPATAAARRDSPTPLRLTRRGRLVLTLFFLGMLLVAFSAFGARSAATGTGGDPVPTRSIVVQQGDTLWDIARGADRSGDLREMVHRIIELNALSGAELTVGQRLSVPHE